MLPGRGHALGKLGSFHWVFVIYLLPALLCALGFAGLALVWCVIGSAAVGGLLRGWPRQEVAPR